MKYYIGIDGGGSKTLLRMADENGTVVFEEQGAGSNPYTVAPEEAERLLHSLIGKAKAAIPDGGVLDGICIGAAGADTKEDYVFFDRVLKEASGSTKTLAVNDGYASLYATLKEQPGVVIASGTGSICWGKNDAGEVCRVGGWGYLFSDEGSGYSMVGDAMKTVVRTMDGRASKGALLLEQLMDAFGVDTYEELVSEIYRSPSPQRIAAYFPLVSRAAAQKDPLAMEVVDRGMEELVELVASTARRIGMYPVFTVGMTGSILTKVELTRELFMQKMIERFPKCTIVEDRTENVDGALYLARHKASEITA